MMQETKLSVIVPAYNAAQYLGEALNSIFVATGAVRGLECEVIVVDDGSDDDTARVAAGFPVRCERIGHAGVAAARNHGYALATGELLAGLDADDRWSSERLLPQLTQLKDDAALDVSYGFVQQFAVVSGRTELVGPPVPGRLPGTMLLRRAAFVRVGGFDTSLVLGEFMDWLVRARRAGIREQVSNHVCLFRRLHERNLGSVARDHRGDYLTIAHRSLQSSRNRRSE